MRAFSPQFFFTPSFFVSFVLLAFYAMLHAVFDIRYARCPMRFAVSVRRTLYLSGAILFFFIFLSGCATTKKMVTAEPQSAQGKLNIAVFPIENLSATAAPLKDIRLYLIERLIAQGFHILKDDVLEKFMAQHRIRYAGGIDRQTAKAFKEETGTEAVLITSLELFSDRVPPKIALISRLVSTGDNPVILWIDGIGLSGDDSPGILGLGLIEDPKELIGKALGSLSKSVAAFLSGNKQTANDKGSQKFDPKVAYRSPVLDPDRKYTLAVTPFFNRSDRKYGGEIMVLHFVRQLKEFENLDIIEPGVVRQDLLNLRIIMDEGVSLANADIISDTLNADLILTGKVIDYQDYQGVFGTPKVDFSIQLLERKSREVVWSSSSYNTGDDGVFFFDRGRVNTAHNLASEMARSIGEMIAR